VGPSFCTPLALITVACGATSAAALDISAATAKRYWVYARSWLYGKMHGQ